MLITILIGCLVYVVFVEVTTFKDTYNAFQKTIILGNEYATSETQDVEIYNKMLSGNRDSKKAYGEWLDNTLAGRETSIDFNGRITSGNAQYNIPSTDGFYYFVDFLNENYNDKNSDPNTALYTPLDFGITYLDKYLLETSMKKYILNTLTELNRFNTTKSVSGYNIDPTTIGVQASITSRVVDLKQKPDYILQIFGAPKSSVSANLSKNESNFMVVYDITYKIKWDYIPIASMFVLSKDQATALPQEDVYYESYIIDDHGVRQPSGLSHLKWRNQDGIDHKFTYAITN